MSLTLGLHAALTGLATSQKGIDVTSHNIANVNTKGYTRKIFNQEAVVVDGKGAGVRSGFYSRQVDMTLQRDLWRETGIYEMLSVKNTYMSRIQDMFGEPASDSSIAHTISKMQAAFENLAAEPNKVTAQNGAVTSAVQFTDQLNNLSKFTQNLRVEADIELSEITLTINSLLERIDTLNDNIVRIDNSQTQGSDDLKDQRDEAIRQLSELIDITYYQRNTGEIIILTKSGKSLLDRQPVTVTHDRSGMISASLTHSGGTISGFYAGEFDITSEIRSGRTKGLIELRDNILPSLQAELDEMAVKLRDEINVIHNRGSNFPNLSSNLTSNRTFLAYDSEDLAVEPLQRISIENGDVRISLFDSEGDQYFTATLGGDLGFTEGPIHNAYNHPDPYEVIPGPPDVEKYTLTATIENWLKSEDGPNLQFASVSINASGQLEIDLGTSEYGIAFRDESSSAPGSSQQDVTIKFDANDDGVNDTTHYGFSYFFGFNNFFEASAKEWIHDTDIISGNVNLGISTPATLYFSDEGGYSSNPLNINFGSVQINPTDSIKDLVDRINEDTNLNERIRAEMVKETSGYRLRIIHNDGQELKITGDELGNTVLTRLGMKPSNAGLATEMTVKDVIANSAGYMNRGAMQYDINSGEYFLSAADNTVINEIAQKFTSAINFSQAGGISNTSTTFVEYAASIVGNASATANIVYDDLNYQANLKDALELKVGEISGVNLDEELAMLIVFQQSYGAAAKVISTISTMLDILNNMV